MTTATRSLTTPTVEQFKWHVATELQPIVLEMLAKRAYAECERERVDAYTRPIFAAYVFPVNPEFAAKGLPISIQNADDLYLCDMESAEYKEYCERVLDTHAAHGWTGNREFCPALVAEHEQVKAEQAVVQSMAQFMGIDASLVYGEKRKQLIDLAVGACFAKE